MRGHLCSKCSKYTLERAPGLTRHIPLPPAYNMSFERTFDWGAQLLYGFPFESHQQISIPDPSTWAQPLHSDFLGQAVFENIVSHHVMSQTAPQDFNASAWTTDYASPPDHGPEWGFPPTNLRSGSFDSCQNQATANSTNYLPQRQKPRTQSYSQPSGKVAKARASFLPRQSPSSKRTHTSKPAPAYKARRQSVPLGQVCYQRWDEFLKQSRPGREKGLAANTSLHEPIHCQDWASDIQWGSDERFQTTSPQSQASSVDSELELARYKELVVCNAFRIDEAESSIEIRIPSNILLSQREDFVEYQRPARSTDGLDVSSQKSPFSMDSEDGSSATQSDRKSVKPHPQRVRPPRKAMPEEKRRQNHIRSEQRRRSRVEELYVDLRSLVPTLSEARYTKSTTLELTTEWVKDLSQGNDALRQQLAKLQGARAECAT